MCAMCGLNVAAVVFSCLCCQPHGLGRAQGENVWTDGFQQVMENSRHVWLNSRGGSDGHGLAIISVRWEEAQGKTKLAWGCGAAGCGAGSPLFCLLTQRFVSICLIALAEPQLPGPRGSSWQGATKQGGAGWGPGSPNTHTFLLWEGWDRLALRPLEKKVEKKNK